ncbi:MAG: heavy-metal-associated domain-containing protein [Bacteroidales bacterium]|nr:heavy-metal-associated domain-containing protein [Bacteroidales bacterium]
MKTMKILASFLVLFLALQVTGYSQCSKDNPIQTVKYKVNSQGDQCKTIIETALNNTDGVQSSNLDLITNIVTVKFNKSLITKADVAKVLTDKGYTAEYVANTSTNTGSHNCSHPCGHNQN